MAWICVTFSPSDKSNGGTIMAGVIWQYILLGVVGSVFGSWYANDLETESAVVTLVAALFVAAIFFGSIVIRELREVNDQLAGRPSKLR